MRKDTQNFVYGIIFAVLTSKTSKTFLLKIIRLSYEKHLKHLNFVKVILIFFMKSKAHEERRSREKQQGTWKSLELSRLQLKE